MVNFATGYIVKTVGTDTTEAYTGIGFEPKALWLWTSNLDDGNEGGIFGSVDWTMGFSDGTNGRAFEAVCIDNTSPTDCALRTSTSAIWVVKNGGVIRTGTVDSFDPDGFTILWDNNQGFNTSYHYIAIGGADVENVNVGDFEMPDVTGDFAVTGVGFQPDLVIFIGLNVVTDNADLGDRCSWSIGWLNAAGEQAVCATFSQDNVNPSNTSRTQRTDRCLIIPSTTSSTSFFHTASFSSMDEDGFTLNFNTASSATPNRHAFYMAIKGPATKIGSFNSDTTTGPQSVTSVGFEPRGVIFQSFGNTANTNAQTHLRHSFGTTDGTNQGVMWNAAEDNNANIATAKIVQSNNVIRVSDEAASAASTSTQALADFTSFDSDGFTIDWSVQDGTAYQILYLAFGDGEVVTVEDARKPLYTNFTIRNELTPSDNSRLSVQI